MAICFALSPRYQAMTLRELFAKTSETVLDTEIPVPSQEQINQVGNGLAKAFRITALILAWIIGVVTTAAIIINLIALL
jgi:hypothetical protein